MYDFRGRLLHVDTRHVTLDAEASQFDFGYRLADHGVRVDTLWAQVAARAEGHEWGRAETRFYNYETWSTRNEYQWSTWSGIACAPPSLVPMAMRLMAHAGMNSLGYPGRRELHYPAERWGWLLTRSGHNNYWVDVPLMFNNDLTHTRASFAMRRWTHRFGGHERIILNSSPAPSDIGLLTPNGLFQDGTRGYMAKSLQVALSQGGFGLPDTDTTKLARYKIILAVARQAVTEEEADQLNEYVQQGGTLVFTARFATQNEHGVPRTVLPGCGLADKWDFEVTERADPIPRHHNRTMQSFNLGPLGGGMETREASGYTIFRESVRHQSWSELAAYDDGTPAILERTFGNRRLVYVNAIYNSHRYIQWVTPTGAERQGFYKLVEWLCKRAGARRTLRLEGDLAELLHVAVKQFTDPTGHIRYVILRTGGEVPWIAGKLRWLDSRTAAYDVLDASPLTLGDNREVALNLRPGAGRLLAFVKRPLEKLGLDASPPRISAGQPLTIKVTIRDADGAAVPGSFPLELTVTASNGRQFEGLSRSFSAESGDAITLNTALSDPPGQWTLAVTDGISGLSAVTHVEVRQPATASDAPGFIPWGWPSELEEPAVFSPTQFIARLERLAKLYRTDYSRDGWMTKQRLGYYYDFFPETRHALIRPLLDLDWTDHTDALREAIRNGATLILTGEDLGPHPGSGLETYPHHDARQFEALAIATKGVTWSLATRDGDTIAATLGKGRLILCRESFDAAGHDNPSAARWQQRWLAELKLGEQNPVQIKEPSQQELVKWWTGQQPITDGQREVRWFAGNHCEVTISANSAQTLGPIFELTIPPTGTVERFTLHAAVDRPVSLHFDISADGTVDAELTVGEGEHGLDWTDHVARAASKALHRDDNHWRIVPVRVHADGQAELTLKDVLSVVN